MLYNAALGQRQSQTGSQPPAPVFITPSAKLLKPFYWTAAILTGLILFYSNNKGPDLYWLLVVPAVIVAWTLVRHFRLRYTRLGVGGGKLKYETGLFSRSVRTMELAKVQNVRVDQTFMDRILNLGTISIETAGESSQLSMVGIDSPQQVAEFILAAAGK